MDIEQFDDNSTIEWFSKESLFYSEGERTVQIPYDYFKLGWFRTGRLILSKSIHKWETFPENGISEIEERKKVELLGKAQLYFEKRKIESRIE